MEKQLASEGAELEAAEKERADLEKEEYDLGAILAKENARLDAQTLELKPEHKLDYKELDDQNKLDYKELDDQNNQLIEERLQQENRIIDLEYQIQLVKDDLAYGPMEGSVVGAGDDLSAEEQAYQQAQRQHSS
jgi:hypothetical protein